MITVESKDLAAGSNGDSRSVVVAFSESARLRETLAILLERDCCLRFLDTRVGTPADIAEPDLALIALSPAADLVPRLMSRWPSMPIVAIDLSDRRESSPRSAGVPSSVQVVSLEPDAIRTAVLRRIPGAADAALRGAVRSVIGTLQRELTYAFSALRSFVALQSANAGADAHAILAAVTTEQCHAIVENLDYLHAYLERPHFAAPSGGFVVAVCQQLEQSRSTAAQREMRCVCTVETPTACAAGPVDLAPLLASLLHAHLRRRAAVSVVDVRATSRDVTIRYQTRDAPRPVSQSWPLLLASALLEPRFWRIVVTHMDNEDILNVCPLP